jgi:(1->4)-alpha-D-glucan 1-alpha-D-glucosylmutase
VLQLAAQQAEQAAADEPGTFSDWAELESIITQLRNLPPGSRRDAASMEERYREQSIVRRRLHQLVAASSAVKAALDAALQQINGECGNPRSFDQLEMLLERQWYRLAYWRVAADEINYRRFFDINDLAAIRVENPSVFEAVHRLVGRLLVAGWVTGLRIDHPDGLRDPLAYFKNLQALYRAQQPPGENDASEIYIVAEKILTGDEPLSAEWPVCGTTGYDLMNLLGRVQVYEAGLAELREFYDQARRSFNKPADVVYDSKRDVLFSSMASELQMLAAELYRIAQRHRASRDFTRPALQRALREVIASMGVYRTYVRDDSWDVSDADYRTVSTAVRMAKWRNRTMPVSLFDFLAAVLLLEHPPTLSEDQALERRAFTLTMQQVTGPVAAKGVEDTAFYRYYPLASLNEVGGELDARPVALDEFHRLMRHRCASWPHSLSATATHDSKRGEDVRARLHVLSEAPAEWREAFQRWQRMNRPFIRELDGDPVPDANEEYLLYQTLVGAWPQHLPARSQCELYRNRILQYMEKALREAKVHTSWMSPSEAYEAAVRDFIGDLFDDNGRAFLADVNGFVEQIADSGYVNSLTQSLLKITLPGVPDFYQGTELWDFSLVDPDNRRPVDFAQRRRRLHMLLAEAERDTMKFAGGLSARWPDSDIKLWITSRALALRVQWPDVFTVGDYTPLAASGAGAEHVVAFSRRWEDSTVVVAAARHFYRLTRSGNGLAPPPAPHANWADTQLCLPEDAAEAWRCVLSGRVLESSGPAAERALALSELFSVFPVALLTSSLE